MSVRIFYPELLELLEKNEKLTQINITKHPITFSLLLQKTDDKYKYHFVVRGDVLEGLTLTLFATSGEFVVENIFITSSKDIDDILSTFFRKEVYIPTLFEIALQAAKEK